MSPSSSSSSSSRLSPKPPTSYRAPPAPPQRAPSPNLASQRPSKRASWKPPPDFESLLKSGETRVLREEERAKEDKGVVSGDDDEDEDAVPDDDHLAGPSGRAAVRPKRLQSLQEILDEQDERAPRDHLLLPSRATLSPARSAPKPPRIITATPPFHGNPTSPPRVAEPILADEPPVSSEKRRSIFRSAGTASSPDIATLMKAKRAAAASSAAQPKSPGSASGNISGKYSLGAGVGSGPVQDDGPVGGSLASRTTRNRSSSSGAGWASKGKGGTMGKVLGKMFGHKDPHYPLFPASLSNSSSIYSSASAYSVSSGPSAPTSPRRPSLPGAGVDTSKPLPAASSSTDVFGSSPPRLSFSSATSGRVSMDAADLSRPLPPTPSTTSLTPPAEESAPAPLHAPLLQHRSRSDNAPPTDRLAACSPPDDRPIGRRRSTSVGAAILAREHLPNEEADRLRGALLDWGEINLERIGASPCKESRTSSDTARARRRLPPAFGPPEPPPAIIASAPGEHRPSKSTDSTHDSSRGTSPPASIASSRISGRSSSNMTLAASPSLRSSSLAFAKEVESGLASPTVGVPPRRGSLQHPTGTVLVPPHRLAGLGISADDDEPSFAPKRSESLDRPLPLPLRDYSPPRRRGSEPTLSVPGSSMLHAHASSSISDADDLPSPAEQSIRLVTPPDLASSTTASPASTRRSTTPTPAASPAPSACGVRVHAPEAARKPSTSSIAASAGEPEPEVLERAQDLGRKCWAEDETFLAKEKIAEWLGSIGQVNRIALRTYMDFFDFTGLRLDIAFRRLTAKLFLKAETQQVDRILEAFSRRFWECNPGSVYTSADVVHAIAYSLLLLNTDLHVAELATHMSRSQFVRNTLSVVHQQLRPRGASGGTSTPDLVHDDASSMQSSAYDLAPTLSDSAPPSSMRTRLKRSGSLSSASGSTGHLVASPGQLSPAPLPSGAASPASSLRGSSHDLKSRKSGSLTNVSSAAYMRQLDAELESLLKDMYNAVRQNRILQPLDDSISRRSTSSLSPGSPYGSMNRTKSTRSQTSIGGSDRVSALKRGSIRGIQNLLSSSNPYGHSASSSGPSDGRVSPTPSTATSSDGYTSTLFTPTIGFASNLSQTIIREQQEDDMKSVKSVASSAASITDEELALLGAPWAKEGVLQRKHYWESERRRAKDKAWLEVFVVISCGELKMFTFGAVKGGSGGGMVGGGNWTSNANLVGEITLTHSIATALPSGYNRSRPHCFAVTLPGGSCYFFQAGTEHLVDEWVSTCNYWAARLSKEPLAGGVSNMEYGWNRVVAGDDEDDEDDGGALSPNDAASVRSARSRSSFQSWHGSVSAAGGSRGGMSADKIYINDWTPPQVPTVSSTLGEEGQLDALKRHIDYLKRDLESHNDLHEAMLQLYSPRSSNREKAKANWERKSKHILSEIVKYEKYVDSLSTSIVLRMTKQGERQLERALGEDGPPEEEVALSSVDDDDSFHTVDNRAAQSSVSVLRV